MKPLVSVIIPVYNAEKYFIKCIESVIQQTYSELEIILVNDGSTDKSGNLCDGYAEKDKRIIVHHQRNQGVSTARNWALDHMHGDYLIFVDSDDIISTNLVEICLNVSLCTKADIVVFELQRMMKAGQIINFQQKTAKINDYENSEYIRKKILTNKISNYLMTNFYKSQLWTDIRLPLYSSHEDLYILPRIFARAEKIVHIDNVLYGYNRMNLNSLSAERTDFDVRKRYYKYKAYEEHRFWARQLNDKESYEWAVFHMMRDAIKIFYVNFYSSTKLTPNEINEILLFIKDNWSPLLQKTLGKKMVALRWFTIHFPYFCKSYGFIRYYQERLKRWIKK